MVETRLAKRRLWGQTQGIRTERERERKRVTIRMKDGGLKLHFRRQVWIFGGESNESAEETP